MKAEVATAIREQLVDAAVRLLTEEGPAAVQARRVAREIGASTMAVYHYFGGMPDLLRAVVEDGFRQLDAHLAAVPDTEDPVADICVLALAYRAAAHENPHLYDLMFGLSAPGGQRPAAIEPPPAAETTEGAYAHLVSAAARATAAGRIRTDDPTIAAAQLWSLLHGYVTLELSGHFHHLDDSVTRVLVPMGTNLLVGLGDTPERAARSARSALDSAEHDR